jgi:tRNA-dihydrouridine synthase
MKSQKEFIEDLQCSASSTIASDASIMPSGMSPEGMRSAIDRIEVKKTKGGKVHGMRVEETESSTNKRLTARMIHFVNLLVSGNDHITAYSTAYDVSGSTRASIIANANKLMRDPRITMQLESVLEATKQNVVESDASARRYVMQKLFDKVNEAEVSESGQLRALELIGKAVGMFTDRVETTVEQVDTDSLKKELESHLHLLENANKKVKTIQ